MRTQPLHIAMISMHSSPIGRLGTPDTGGMSVYIRELARRLGGRGHRVDIFTRAESGGFADRVQPLAENVRLVALSAGGGGALPKTALFPHVPAFFDALDQFHTATHRNYDLIHSHYWLSGLVGQRARQAWGVPHITTFHTLGKMKLRVCGPGTEPAARIRAERKLVEVCDRVLLTSAREKANLLRDAPARPTLLDVVPCGVNLELFQPILKPAARRRIGAAMDDAILLFVGRIAPEKGLDQLLCAFAHLPHRHRVKVVVVGGEGGGDPGLQQAQALARGLGVAERIRFVGRVEQPELPYFYSAADMLVLPSAYESFGMVALEAIACGTPVVATPVGAMEELLHSGASGRLAADSSAVSLAAAIDRMLRDRAERPVAPEAVRRSALRFSWHRVAADVLKVYRLALATHAAAHAHRHAGDDGHPSHAACCGCGMFAAAESGG
ncbi:MAG: glycosyltransferase [Desulfobacterales bacterium]|jgi:D-inositol-3-phosphate glycosyltransferase|nr:glycosyltransferase [Desulfobacterales bacterium]